MSKVIKLIYTNFLKHFLFLFDPEIVHNHFVSFGHFLGEFSFTRDITRKALSYSNPRLYKKILGIEFPNPIGLSAGFDYNGNLPKILPSVGFGFCTVGTVTNLPYKGNPVPRLVRLPKSKALLVNKGFKSIGVDAVVNKINDPFLEQVTFGVSVGSSNLPHINTIDKAISDYVACFTKLKVNPYIKYFELNISCPNTAMTEGFTIPDNYTKLLDAILSLNLGRPLFIKMPSEGDISIFEQLVDLSLDRGVFAFIFSNLVKDRTNTAITQKDRNRIVGLKGNISGVPTKENSLNLVRHFRSKYGDKIIIVGCGGVFSPKDAADRIAAGADLVQLITGMIYQGPQLIGDINRYLAKQ